MIEKTVVLIKPDGVKKGLIGEILSRFEKVGLKLVASKLIWIDKTHVGKHYADKDDYHKTVGEKTLENYKKYGFDAKENLGTTDSIEIGRMVRQWNMEFLTSGPIVVVLLQGVHAVDAVRMMVGNTLPRFATPGTIRGDYSLDSPILANLNKRTVKNMIHASSSIEEASFEEQLWFHQGEIYDYKRADEAVMF